MIVYKHRFVTVGEVWFDEEPAQAGVDIIEYRQRLTPTKGAQCTPFHTRIVNLQRNPDEILSEFKKGTRYEIRRGESKDRLSFDWLDAPQDSDVSEFCEFYDAFAATKSLAPLNRPRALLYVQSRALSLSRMRCSDGAVVVWHAYLRAGNRARLLHSASLYRATDDHSFRSFVGRANRLLHWLDMQKLRSECVAEYDLGGWYAGDADRILVAINAFKEEFGGRTAVEYNAIRCVTLKGRFFTLASSLLSQKRKQGKRAGYGRRQNGPAGLPGEG